MAIDSLLMALIGLAGIIVGSVVTILVARVQASPKIKRSKRSVKGQTIHKVVDGIKFRECRILRALFGESEGRYLDTFQKRYYRPSLDATIEKGWVAQVGSRYYLTSSGVEVCGNYLIELLKNWKPVDQVSDQPEHCT